MPTTPNRHSAGSPDGGRFAVAPMAETQVSLVDPGNPDPATDEHGSALTAGQQATREYVEDQARRGQSLACTDLTMVDLSNANLAGVDLSRADLFAANLADADLIGADLNSADARRADLTGAALAGANLCATDMTGARIDSRTGLEGVSYDDATRWPANITPPPSARYTPDDPESA